MSLPLLSSAVCLVAWALADPSPAPPQAGNHRLVDAVIYATRSDNRLHMVDAKDLSPICSLNADLGAHETAVSSDGRWAVGSAYGGPGPGHQPADNRIAVLDLSAASVHRIIDLAEIKRPNDAAFIPGSSEFIVTAEVPPRLLRISAETGSVKAIELTNPTGHMLALNPNGDAAYVSHVLPGKLTFIDLRANRQSHTISLPAGAEGIACSPDGGTIWVASNRSDSISIVDTAKREVTETLECAGFPFRLRFSKDGSRVAVTCPNTAEVAIFDAEKRAEIGRIKLSTANSAPAPVPTGIAFTPSGDSIAVLCEGRSPEIVLIDIAARSVRTRVRIAEGLPDALSSARVRVPVPPAAGN